MMKRTIANKKMYNCMALRTITFLCIVSSEILMLSHTLEASDSCSISRYTVQKVENCPESKEKWKEAAARKKCEDYAIFCDEPKRLKYHCVISSFINETLEVCAYTQNIVLDPGCYELTKRSKKQRPIHLTVLSSIYEPTHTTTNSSELLLAGEKHDSDSNTEKVVWVISCILSSLVIGLSAMIIFICALKYITASKTKKYMSEVNFL